MKFWKENQVSQEFDMPVSELADRITAWMMEAGVPLREHPRLTMMNLENFLRWWLTSSDHLNSVWEAENRQVFGEESFDGLYDRLHARIYGHTCQACRSGKGQRTCGLSGLQDMIRLG